MKLLFITQKVDRNDAVLGFVHAWLLEFAKHFSDMTVLCLERGEYDLPNAVRVVSMGKESGKGRLNYLRIFFQTIVHERKRYDAVFIHMNPIYAILGGFPWFIFRKPVILWYIHPKADPLLFWARPFINFVATASEKSFPLPWKEVRAVGHGIDTDFFSPREATRMPNSLLAVGRIAPIKRLELIQEALNRVVAAGQPFSFDIIGGKDTKELSYYRMIQERYRAFIDAGCVRFLGSQSMDAVRAAYHTHEVLVNFTPTGSFDKVVLEAMSCEAIPVTGNAAFKEIVPDGCFVEDDSSEGLFRALCFALSLPHETKKAYGYASRTHILKHHNLKTLPEKIKSLFAELRAKNEA